jgi:biotin carboxyl carrier protein
VVDLEGLGTLMPRTLRVGRDDQGTKVVLQDDGRVAVDGADGGFEVSPGGSTGEWIVRDGAAVHRVYLVAASDQVWTFHNGRVFELRVDEESAARRRSAHHHGSLTAPMPATVISVNVAPGDAVERGQILVVLEAMKMELPVRAPAAGMVGAVNCSPGELVQPGASLVDME